VFDSDFQFSFSSCLRVIEAYQNRKTRRIKKTKELQK